MTTDRAYYRVRYPISARPTLHVSGTTTPVLDVAEYGISFWVEALHALGVGDRLAGRLQIGDRHTLDVEGRVVWIADGLAAIRLHEPIPYKVILEEQLHLRTRYSGI